MTQVRHKDGDGDDSQPPQEIFVAGHEDDGEDEYKTILASDPALRAFVAKHYISGGYEIDGRILCENLDKIFNWIKSGAVPDKNGRAVRSVPKTLKENFL